MRWSFGRCVFEEGSRLVFCVAYSTSHATRLVISRYFVSVMMLTSYTRTMIALKASERKYVAGDIIIPMSLVAITYRFKGCLLSAAFLPALALIIVE